MVVEKKYNCLLSTQALDGKNLGISVSESEDIDKLGLSETHFKLTLAEIARTIIISGGNIYYGGHLRPEGYTVLLIEELQKYGRRDRPLKICLNWVEHQSMGEVLLEEQKQTLGLFGEIIRLSPEGEVVDYDLQQKEPVANFSPAEKATALTGLRRFLASNTTARIFLGGKRRGYSGKMPGLVEEAIFSLKEKTPLFLTGGFGGVTLDIIDTFHPHFTEWFPKNTFPSERATIESLKMLAQTAKTVGWNGSENGLTEQENALLAASYRPSEIAALVSLGLGRL